MLILSELFSIYMNHIYESIYMNFRIKEIFHDAVLITQKTQKKSLVLLKGSAYPDVIGDVYGRLPL